MVKPSREAAYFEKLYEANPDPWGFLTSAYERDKYQETLALLGNRTFNSAFEIGCSIGVLTRQLAARCERLLAVDVAEGALTKARAHCAGLANITFENRQIPLQWPERRRFDLILFSEVLYFLSPADVAAAARCACASLAPSGVVLLVNYTSEMDEPCSGDMAAEVFIAAAARLRPGGRLRQPCYRIDLLAAEPG